MAVKILIKRKVPEVLSKQLTELLMEMRTLTTHQPGYISGETLHRLDSPDEVLVISSWQSVDAWRTWVASSKRKGIQEKIDVLLGGDTSYEIYEYM